MSNGIKPWENAPSLTRIAASQLAAAQQSNGCVQFWAITTDGILISISQISPGGGWGGWS
jgi:hypothetical protein